MKPSSSHQTIEPLSHRTSSRRAKDIPLLIPKITPETPSLIPPPKTPRIAHQLPNEILTQINNPTKFPPKELLTNNFRDCDTAKSAPLTPPSFQTTIDPQAINQLLSNDPTAIKLSSRSSRRHKTSAINTVARYPKQNSKKREEKKCKNSNIQKSNKKDKSNHKISATTAYDHQGRWK